MERYSSLFRLPEKLYTQGSPLLIAAGALLKDNQTGNILAQIKFRGLSNKEIKAVKVNIRAFDISGAEMQGVDGYQYLDLSAARNAEFGQKTAVTLPDSVTRSFSVVCTSVIFSDNSVWEAEENAVWEPLPKQQNLENLIGNLAQQYRRDTSIQSHLEPLEYSDLWICSCGAVNRRRESQCCCCGVNRNTIFSALNAESLTQNQSQFEAKEAERRTIQERETKKRQAKIKKIAIISSAAAVVVIVFAVLITQVFIPMQQYNSAVSLMDAGNYEEAITAFEELGDYSDSAQKIEECAALKEEARLQENYQEAMGFLDNGDYPSAIKAFSNLGNYKDSQEQVKKATYQYANNLVENKDFNAAIDMFYSLGEYQDANSQAEATKQLQIDYIYQLIEEEKYDEAWEEYYELSDYQVATLSKKDFLVTVSEGSETIDTHSDASNHDSEWVCYYYDPATDKSREGVVKTARGIQLGDTRLEVQMAYGYADDSGSFSKRHNFYKDADSTVSSAMERDCETYLCYSMEDNEDYEIYFYFDENEELSFIFFAYDYSLTSVVAYWPH